MPTACETCKVCKSEIKENWLACPVVNMPDGRTLHVHIICANDVLVAHIIEWEAIEEHETSKKLRRHGIA